MTLVGVGTGTWEPSLWRAYTSKHQWFSRIGLVCIDKPIHTDIQRLMLTLPFLLDGLAQDKLQAFNTGKPQDQRVTDPMPEGSLTS